MTDYMQNYLLLHIISYSRRYRDIAITLRWIRFHCQFNVSSDLLLFGQRI